MKLNALLKLDPTRNIETVIKADDDTHIHEEVHEYVITKEIAKKIKDFFSAYNHFEGANGAWISGFFGSGKSHLLKIMSYVLENKEYQGELLGDVFAEKVKEDELLKAEIKQATRIPSESVLFNIDQQAQITSKDDKDAIVRVFYKVFYDHLGFFGRDKSVAEFELWLYNEGIYSEFQKAFQSISGKEWKDARRQTAVPTIRKYAGEAVARIKGEEIGNYLTILDDFKERHQTISVEEFAERVKAYIDTKPKGFRLNFFIDEVGQFISNDTKLMLNLQTVAETLATFCKGQSWVLVTSQEDLEAAIGDMKEKQKNDFSRIQARFRYRPSLTSANVDEVIERRLLEKTADGDKELVGVWAKEQANIDTLISFDNIGVQFKKFRGREDFVNKYPFLPYQFELFQQCIKSLSRANAFQGKHASVGERSMLGVFQEVLKKNEFNELKKVVSFDLFYEGVSATIKGEIQNSIQVAERNLPSNQVLARQVLKTLFLLKYYDNFKTTKRNIAVLLIDGLNIDLNVHNKAVEQALNLLEAQTYIQRNGELYEYLTDDEKDIEAQIKNTSIDNGQVTQVFNEILFDSIIQDNRIRYLENKEEYKFQKIIDGTPVSREEDLILEIATPNNDNSGNEEVYKSQTMGAAKLLFALPQDSRILKDVRLMLQTEKYLKQVQGNALKDAVKGILRDKGEQNASRKRELVSVLKHALGQSKVFMNGSELELSPSSDGKTRVVNAFQDLVKQTFFNLKMLGNTQWSEQTVRSTMDGKDDLFKADDTTMSEAELTMLGEIKRRKQSSERTSLNELKDIFSGKPYGWPLNGTLTILARLYKRGKIEAKQDSSLLDDNEFQNALLNSRQFSNTLIEPQEEFEARLVKNLKQVYQELFDSGCPANDARDVANEFKFRLKEELAELRGFSSFASQYPFLTTLKPLEELMTQITSWDYSRIIKEVADFEDKLLDAKEDTWDPIRKFWNGEQKVIFDKVRSYMEGNQSNFDFVDGEELKTLRTCYKSDKPYQGSLMKDAKHAMDALQEKVLVQVEEERKKALERLSEARATIEGNSDLKRISDSEKKSILSPLDEHENKIKETRYIANLKQYQSEAGSLVTNALNRIQEIIRKKEEAAGEAKMNEPKVHYIQSSQVKVAFGSKELRTEEDVNEYVEALREALLEQIKQNRRINI